MAEKSPAIPFLPAPANCEGYVGNVGFDPLRVSEWGLPVDYLREAELKHGAYGPLSLSLSLFMYIHVGSTSRRGDGGRFVRRATRDDRRGSLRVDPQPNETTRSSSSSTPPPNHHQTTNSPIHQLTNIYPQAVCACSR